jgi:hypothetical protein
MQYQQHHPADLHRALRASLAVLLLLAATPLLAWAVEGGQPPSPPSPAPRVDPGLGVPIGEPLLSPATHEPPAMDGVVEAAWEQAPVLAAPLHYGLHGSETAGAIELRSLHDDEQVYFLAQWPAATPGGEPDAWRNLFTVHWRLVDPGLVSGDSTGSSGLACDVACHTATADGQGDLVGIRIETIPPGLDENLPAGGGWAQGTWTLEWSRPRLSDSPYDQNLVDPARGYRFFAKIFQGLEGRADPTTDVHELRLNR